ncbi:hypothetical protein D3C86_1314470 [compost metagenome]
MLMGTYLTHTTNESGVSLNASENAGSLIIDLLWFDKSAGVALPTIIFPSVRFPFALATTASRVQILAE